MTRLQSHIWILTFSLLMVFHSLKGQSYNFQGVNSGKKITIYNPSSSDFIGTCIQRIIINGEVYPTNISASYIELDLNTVGIEKNEFFNLSIEHKDGCEPLIYNAIDFASNESNIIQKITIQDTTIYWDTKDEVVNSDFVIEFKFRGNWHPLTKISSDGAGNRRYKYKIPMLISGDNQFRIYKQNTKQKEYKYTSWLCQAIEYRLESTSVTKKIHISHSYNAYPTYYQLEDQHKVVVKSGYGDVINVSDLNSGFYTLYYDNRSAVIVKK